MNASGEIASEVRLVEPADYRFFLKVTKIPGFGVREGWYLLKSLGGGVFESDATWPDGHIRVTVVSRDELLLTPLFTLPKKEGLVQPLKMRPIR